MKTKHTPGPWRTMHKLSTVNFWPIGTVDYCEVLGPNKEANAKLIADAPQTAAERDKLKEINSELLDSLKGMLESFEVLTSDVISTNEIFKGVVTGAFTGEIQKAKDAIKKATS